MTVFIMEKNISGLLSALFYSFIAKKIPEKITDGKNYQQQFGDEFIVIKNNSAEGDRVQNALIRYGGYEIVSKLKICLCSCEENASLASFNFAYLTLSEKKDVSDNLSDPIVSQFIFTEQKVWTERHRIMGFLRFKESQNGVIYAKYSPDNDVTELVAPHFLKRLSGLPFVIHDVKRGKIAISNGYELKFDATDLAPDFSCSKEEKTFENLWKRYYKEVNIKERKNLRQQDNYMPRRYRKYMPETYENES